MVDPARLQAAQAVSQRNICDINKRPRHIFSLDLLLCQKQLSQTEKYGIGWN